ncbi:PTS sugar transporter subunit IIA, partial [Staphylococcus aureus]
MKIQDLLRKDIMILDLQAISKEVAIDEMITKLVEKDIVHDFDVFKKSIMTREEQTSTGLGDGIAMP